MLVLPNPASAISTRFTSPLKLFEYMAAGRPIVASDLPAIREVLRDEVNALLVTPAIRQRSPQAIERLLADPALARRLARSRAERRRTITPGRGAPNGSRRCSTQVTQPPMISDRLLSLVRCPGLPRRC